MSEGKERHNDVCFGLTYGMLTSEPAQAAEYLKCLQLVSRDGFATTLDMLKRITLDKYTRLQDLSRHTFYLQLDVLPI